MSEGGLEPPPWWYITRSVIHHHSKLTRQRPARARISQTTRGGSTGLPGKNTRMLLGKPLLAWSIEAALGCSKIESVWVTSDDENALRIATEYGARAYRRPAHLANDSAPMGPVITDFGRGPSA